MNDSEFTDPELLDQLKAAVDKKLNNIVDNEEPISLDYPDDDFEPEEFLTESTGMQPDYEIYDEVEDVDLDEEEEIEKLILAHLHGSTAPSDPLINGYNALKNPQTEAAPLSEIKRKHRTLCFVLTCADPSDTHRERATKAVSAFNSPTTMKADLVSVSDGKLYPGLVWAGEEPGGVDLHELAAAAQDLGYAQFVIVGCIYGTD